MSTCMRVQKNMLSFRPALLCCDGGLVVEGLLADRSCVRVQQAKLLESVPKGSWLFSQIRGLWVSMK